MNGLAKIIVAAAFTVLAVIAVAPILGATVPESIWGLAIGTISGIVGTLIPAGKERFTIEVPSNYHGKLTFEAEEKG